MYKTPTNKEIATLLNSIADSLEIRSVDQCRVRAFRNGARNVEGMDIEVADAVSEGRLDLLPGIGQKLGGVIDEYVRTRSSQELDQAREGIPAGLFEILGVRGIGPKTAGRLLNELEIESLEDLEQSAASGRLRSLPRMGPKKVETILIEIEKLRLRRGLRLLADALDVAIPLLDDIRSDSSVTEASVVGDGRRGVPIVGDMTILAASADPDAVLSRFRGLCRATDVNGGTATGVADDGLIVRLSVCDPAGFARELVLETGSDAHLERLRQVAAGRSIDLDDLSGLPDERAVYAELGLEFIPAELREDRGEVDAAGRNALPALVATGDLSGDLHCHTRWSDGAHSIEQMARAGLEQGHEYLVISDHSVSLTVARGLDAERLGEQGRAIDEANQEIDGLAILRGTEVDILSDGKLDYGDEVLAGLDWVSAAVHSGFRQSSEIMTERVVSAIRNPHVDSIAHPTGRLLNSRDGYEIDMDAVLEAAAETGTALEINAMPDRLDLPEEHARKAISMGIPIVINSDSHSTEHLDYLKYGITASRRAWLSASNVINTRDLDGLRAWREDRRSNSA